MTLVASDLATMFNEIHAELENELVNSPELTAIARQTAAPARNAVNPAVLAGVTELGSMAKYYFDGQGKAVRPVIAMTLGHAYNAHEGIEAGALGGVRSQQRKVAIISEMIHTASLVHDDILDHAETRRGKPAVNR